MKTKGWKNIYSFTFMQKIKTKSFIISTIIISAIIALIAATANILPVIILEDELGKIEGAVSGDTGVFTIDKLYIADETGLNPNFSVISASFGLTAENIDPSAVEAQIDELAVTSENIMLAVLTNTDGYFGIDAYYSGENSTIDEMDCSSVLTMLSTQLEMTYFESLGITTSQMSTAMGGVSTSLVMAGDAPVSMVEEVLNMVVPMFGSLILFIMIFAYGSMVSEAVAIEKSSRIMEYLLTSVSPLSIIIGKVLAICTVAVSQFIIFILAGIFGFLITMPFGIFSKVEDIMAMAASATDVPNVSGILNEIQAVFSTFNAGTFIVIILSFILGFLIYALIAGLAGASISKMEDLAAANQPLSIIGVLGFYLAYMPQVGNTGGDENIISVVARYVPISSPFCLSSSYMLGQATAIDAAVSIALMAVTVIILCIIVAKVYEHIVLHTGDRLKLKDMLKMADNAKK